MCHCCHNPGHVHRNYRKLQNKNQRFQSVHSQKSLKSVFTSITTLVESSKINTCFISSSFTWVIDSGAIDHMTGNSTLFITFQSYPSTSNVTLVDGLTSCVLGSETIHLTPRITLTYVLILAQFSFNLIFVSKLTRTLNYSISFFPDYCLIQDLSTKQIIGKGHEFGGLCILETEVSKSIACPGVVTPFELHCRLGHPSFSMLKKLYPQFSSISLLNCLLCQNAKLHRVHLSSRVNKRVFAPFELAHSDV